MDVRRGVGVDVCSVARIEAVWREHEERFEARLLTPAERRVESKWDAGKLARRWALKEAVAKALGTGIGGVYGFMDIEVTHDGKGCPQVKVTGVDCGIDASVSDDAGIAVAFAVIRG